MGSYKNLMNCSLNLNKGKGEVPLLVFWRGSLVLNISYIMQKSIMKGKSPPTFLTNPLSPQKQQIVAQHIPPYKGETQVSSQNMNPQIPMLSCVPKLLISLLCLKIMTLLQKELLMEELLISPLHLLSSIIWISPNI